MLYDDVPAAARGAASDTYSAVLAISSGSFSLNLLATRLSRFCRSPHCLRLPILQPPLFYALYGTTLRWRTLPLHTFCYTAKLSCAPPQPFCAGAGCHLPTSCFASPRGDDAHTVPAENHLLLRSPPGADIVTLPCSTSRHTSHAAPW